MQGERGLRTGRGARLVDGTARRGGHLLRMLQDDARLEIRETRLNESQKQLFRWTI